MECNLKNEICGFQCTGFKGGKVWKKFMEIAKQDIDCEHCRDEAMKLLSFLWDFSHGGLGTELYDKSNFLEVAKRVKCVADHVSEHGVE